MKKTILYLLILLVGIGCSNSEPQSSVTNGDDSAEKLIIYSGRSESLVQPIIDDFSAVTGIDVEVRYGSTSEIAGLLLEEGENSPADLFYAQDPGGLGAVADAGLFADLTSDVLGKVPSRFADPNKKWVGISGRARTVVYNSDIITDPATQLPTDLMGFTDPEWDGKIGWAPTNGSFQAMVTGMRSVWGEDQTREWLIGIQANNPTVYPKNTPTVEAVGSGEVTVGFVNHYYLYRFLTEDPNFPAKNYFLPSGGPGSLIMVSGAGILDSAENHLNATRFLNYLLSDVGQQYFTSQTYEYPVVEGINIAQGLAPLAALDTLAIDIPLTDLEDLQGTQDLLLDLGIIE